MRLFCIWNRGYSQQNVIAETAQEALEISVKSGHIRRSNSYRKYADCTDDYVDTDDYPMLGYHLAAGMKGVYERREDGHWTIGGEVVE